jgi:hypothetical protein
MEQRPCPRCGTSNAPDASTCSWCGRPLAGDADPTEPLDRPVGGPLAGEPGEPGRPQRPAGSQQEALTEPQQPAGAEEAPTQPQRPADGSWGQGDAPRAPEGDWGQPAQPRERSEGSWGEGGSRYDPTGAYGGAGGAQGWAPQGGDPGQAPWGPAAPPAPRRRVPLLWVAIAGVLVVVVLAAVAFRVAGNRSNANEPLQAPASVGGFNRIDRGVIRSELDTQEQMLRQRGARNFVVAAYGTELQPQFVLVVVRDANDRARQDMIKAFDNALEQQPGGQGGTTDQTFRQDDVDYRCTSSQLSAIIAICRFDDGDLVGFGFSPGVSPQRVSELTAEARKQMTD